MRSCFFNEAKRCSFKSDYHGATAAKVGAVAVFKGTVIAKGTPEEIAKKKGSYTGIYIKKMLEKAK